MMPEVVKVGQKHWREIVALIAPFVLLLPLFYLKSLWMGVSISWFKSGVLASLNQSLGSGFVRIVFDLPGFVCSGLAGLFFVIVKPARVRVLALLFGLGMFLAQSTPAYLSNRSEWHLCLINLTHIALPVAIVVACLPGAHVTQPNRCSKCGYDLTGNVSGTCPECGRSISSGETFEGDHSDGSAG